MGLPGPTPFPPNYFNYFVVPLLSVAADRDSQGWGLLLIRWGEVNIGLFMLLTDKAK